MVNAGDTGAGVTVSTTCVQIVTPPFVAVMLSGYTPAGVAEVVVTVIAETLFVIGPKVALTPGGSAEYKAP